MDYISVFGQTVARCHADTAIVDRDGERTVTYGELDALSGLVAGKLRTEGCRKGDFVIVNMGRRAEYLAAYLGILKAGCVVVPLVPDYPEERIEFIRKDCGAKLTITEEFFENIESHSAYSNPATDAQPAVLAYTSGSTGTPKGILLSTADLARAAMRHKAIFDGVSPIIYGSAALMSFLIHIIEYITVFALGGTAHIIGDEKRKSVAALAKYYEEHGITIGVITPQMLKLFKNTAPSLQRVLTGSERVSKAAPDGYSIINGYGMSETLAFVTTFNVDRAYDNTPIGKSLGNVEVTIRNDEEEILPDGTEGEICVKGAFDTQYFKDPERTESRLRSLGGGIKLIHTGDIGYVDENGNIVYCNRKDWMVKVNGQRVETMEIEARMTDIPQVTNAAVKAFEDSDGQNYLTAYYVADGEIDEASVRSTLRKTLPEYMIPRFFVRLKEMPRNDNGKLNRLALLPPSADKYKAAYTAPADATEKTLCEAFEDVLRCGTVGTSDDFFSLGGDSIKVLRLLGRVEHLGLAPAQIMKARTPGKIAALCKAVKEEGIPHLEQTPETCPLSDSQLGVFLDCNAEPDSLKYNIPILRRLPKETDTARFVGAVKTVAGHHKAFGVTISSDGPSPMMKYREREIVVEEMHVTDADAAAGELTRPFDLEHGPLYRFVLLHCPEGPVFFSDVHHIIFDGASIPVFIKQIEEVYGGGQCPDERLTLFDVALADRDLPGSGRYSAAQEFFDSLLEGSDCDSAPVPDRMTDDCPEGAGHITLPLDGLTGDEVSGFVRNIGVTENTLFLGAFAYSLARFNGESECRFCTVDNGRHDAGLENSTGMFVRTLPLHFSMEDSTKVSDFLHSVQGISFEAISHDCVRFGELASRYGIRMDVSFVYQADIFTDAEMLHTGDIQSDIHFMLCRKERGYELTVGFRNSLYTESLIRNFAGMYLNVIRGMLSAGRLKEIVLTDEKTRELISRLNRTEVPYESTATVVDLFRRQAALTPNAPCVVCAGTSLTYAEVDGLTDRLARHLAGSGTGKGEIVGILIPRCEYMLIAAVGALKAGAAYLPLDPTYPEDRLNLMMKDSGASFLITAPELNHIITDDFKGRRMMTEDIPALGDSAAALPAPAPDDRFVIIYTSGSTGTPKGVIFKHSNTMVTAAWEKRFYDLGPGSNVAAYASFGFDANVFDMYATVISGATLHIIPDDLRLDLPALRRYFNDKGITHCTMTTQVGRQFALMGGLKSLKYLNVAGEKLTPLAPPEGFSLFNLYGPTEGSILASGFLLDRLYRDVPIGKAVDNVKLYVTDRFGRLLPPGAAGELLISGPHVTAGYLNRPEKTAEAYGRNDFCDEAGYERIYRTGDIVRMLEDGTLQFIGRRDGQVKVRGFRVELTEVEEVIRRFDGVKDATVAAFDEPSGGKFIAAYVVSDGEIDVDALNAFIRSEKPPYMVPAVTMRIDRIPLNQNQKVNRKALPAPVRRREGLIPPETDIQRRIFDIASEVLGHGDFGIDTGLFEAGLTSIGVLKMNVMLSEAFGISVRMKDIRENDTVRKLESVVLGSDRETESYGLQPDYPLTRSQMGIFIECSSNPDSVTYNIPLLVKLGKGADPDRLVPAVRKALSAHPYVKATLFSNPDGEIRVRRDERKEVEVELITIDHTPESEELVRPFPLLGKPLYRASVLKSPEGNCLFLDFHHIISDGTSEAVLLADIDRAYAGENLKAETYSLFEAALDEEKGRASERYAAAKEFHIKTFGHCEGCSLPPKAAESTTPGAGALHRTSSMQADELLDFCRKKKLTPNALFNAAFGYTLSRFCNLDEAVYTTVYNGRSDSRLASAFGMLVKTLPVLVRPEAGSGTVDFIKSVGGQIMESMSNDLFSFAEVSESCGIRADVIFVYQGENFAFKSLCGEEAEFRTLLPPVAKAPFTLTVSLNGGKFEYEAGYRKDFFSQSFIGNFIGALDRALRGLTSCETLDKVSLMSEEARILIDAMNATSRPYRNISVNRLFEERAAAFPEKEAVICDGRSLTYSELNALANALAHILIDGGIGKDSVVAMMLDRCVELPAAELGILKAGGAFLGILPDYPDDRIEYCLTDSGCRIAVTTEAIKSSRKELFAPEGGVRAVTLEEICAETRTDNPDRDIPADSLAYCIYTSGSTGKPKGVMIEHRNLACLAQPADSAYSVYHGEKGGKVSLALSSISFDMSVFDSLLHLLGGNTVCIATDREIHNPDALGRLMTERHVDMIATTPSVLTNYISCPAFRDALKGIKTLVSGAEAFPGPLFNQLRGLSADLHILNGYGPSECTATCAAKELESPRKITIGGPVANTRLYVIDKAGNPLPPYACGELVICGDLVGRGYMNLPDRTAASFFRMEGLPAYRSGDTVRINSDGEVEFFGRVDNQVKLRGYRVELDEIERVVLSFPGISQCKVVVRNNGSADYLACFFTSVNPVDTEKLTTFLRSKLTFYMVPDVLMQIDTIPLTPSGKVDVKALPEVKRESRKGPRKAPRKSLDEQICELFKSVLGIDEFYVDDDFFKMGGTSLSASKAVMQLMAKGFKVEYQDIYDHPTPEGLADYIEAMKVTSDAPKSEETPYGSDPAIAETLRYNTLEFAHLVTRKPLKDVLLTGAVGFLGIHILKELLDRNEGRIICLVRKGDMPDSETRLRNMLMYYFDNPFEEAFRERISVVDTDITDDDLPKRLAGLHFDTLINCAAVVKHYSSDDTIEKVNVHGVENLIRLVTKEGARMIQVSTVSVPGVHTRESYLKQIKMHENELFVIDDMDNKYCISKYHAELKMLEAIRNGLRGKIIRVGNLMGRHSDGEFQINFNTNAFMNALRGFVTIGKCPISHATDPMSFSPVDMTARAIVLLAGTDDRFTAFHADSRFGFDEMQLIEASNRCGLSIVPVSDEEYYGDYYRMLGDEKVNSRLQGLVTNDRPDLHMVDTDNLFTANVLYRLGFSWPLVDNAYLERAIESLLTLDYFEPEE